MRNAKSASLFVTIPPSPRFLLGTALWDTVMTSSAGSIPSVHYARVSVSVPTAYGALQYAANAEAQGIADIKAFT